MKRFQSYHHAFLWAIKSGIYDSILHVNLELASQFLQIWKEAKKLLVSKKVDEKKGADQIEPDPFL